MCGISGIVEKSTELVDTKALKTMNDLISHRGPDSEGFYVHKNVGLGHRRLSIIDLSDNGHQPMYTLNRYVITFNGEIYNYLELREELISEGYVFNSNSDTEVITSAYDCWGVDCLNRFNGMWSFAILDLEENVVFLSRDRFGVKPLYYKEDEYSFLFGSEIKQLISHDGPNYVNVDILLESILTHIDNHTDATYFDGVFSLPAGSYMKYNYETHSKAIQQYYNLKINHDYENLSESEVIELFKDKLNESIDLRLRSDVKVGTCLSGGLDSSAISAIAAKKYKSLTNEEFIAINAKSQDKSNDESHFAEIVANNSCLDLNVIMPTYEDFVNTIDEVIYTQEEPFGSPSMFMGWHVFQKANELNCKVMLNGQGGDEILLGYERYFTATFSLLNPFNFLFRIIEQSINSRLSAIKLFAFFFYFRSSTLRIFRLLNKSFVHRKFIKDQYFNSIKESAKSFNNIDNLQEIEITKIQLPHLLRYEDRNSMRHSIETRLPFLDYKLVELCLSLPIKYKIYKGWTKYVLRKCVDGELPKEIIWRKNKFGFEAPEKIWLEKYESQMIFEIKKSNILSHFCDVDRMVKSFSSLSLKDRWMYFNIARWEKMYNIILESKN